jgi:hypothetical protein
MRRSVAVIFHENEKKMTNRFVITYLAGIWKKEGIDVTFVLAQRRLSLQTLPFSMSTCL